MGPNVCGYFPDVLRLRNMFTCEAYNELITNYLKLLGEYRLEEAAEYIPHIKQLQHIDFTP